MGERFTVRLSEENAEWVAEESADRDRSKAWVIDEVVSAVRGAESTYAHRTGAVHTDEESTEADLGEIRARVATLEGRVDALESAGASLPDETRERTAEPEPAPGGEELSAGAISTPTDEVRRAVETVADSWEDSEERLETRRAAAATVLQHAVDTGDAVGKSSDVVEEVRSEYSVSGQNDETYWRKNIRPVLKEYGEYNQGAHGYHVDAGDVAGE